MESYVIDLKNAHDITYDQFVTDIRSQRFIERTLHIAIESCLDIVHHIISEMKFRQPSSYADAFAVLAENGIIPLESLQEYQPMAKFRNKIVHNYDKIDPEVIYGIFKKRLGTFDRLKKEVEEFCERYFQQKESN
ncbi:MAG: DUF86 domain-containing protein [Candidatus Magnetomorum sp.]|nr:DUF86 domain-containing protein [Candidatus Magnetomorum sp.]